MNLLLVLILFILLFGGYGSYATWGGPHAFYAPSGTILLIILLVLLLR